MQAQGGPPVHGAAWGDSSEREDRGRRVPVIKVLKRQHACRWWKFAGRGAARRSSSSQCSAPHLADELPGRIRLGGEQVGVTKGGAHLHQGSETPLNAFNMVAAWPLPSPGPHVHGHGVDLTGTHQSLGGGGGGACCAPARCRVQSLDASGHAVGTAAKLALLIGV